MLLIFNFQSSQTNLHCAFVLYSCGPQGGKIEILEMKDGSARVVTVDNVNELFSVMT